MVTVKILDNDCSLDEYNRLAKHPMQSWEWGEARKAMGIHVVRIVEFESNELRSVYQLTIHRLGLGALAIGYLPRSQMPSRETLDFLQSFGKKNGLIFIKIEPYETNQTLKRLLPALVLSPHPLFPTWTQILDLTKEESVLFANLKTKTRYNIRLAQKKGVTVKEMSNEEGFDIFQKLYFETCKRQHYFGHTKNYHEIIWNHLKNKTAHLLIAFYDNKPLAAYELFYFNNIFYYPYGGTSEENRNVMAANLLMWEAIKLGKKLGALKFDMWGSLPPHYDHNNSWAGFTRFKEGYGTSFEEMIPGQDLIINPLLYLIYNQIYRIRSMLLAIKKSG